MASKFLRNDKWWIKFRHPVTSRIIRESLGTHDAVRAELLRVRIEVQLQLLEPRFQNVALPAHIAELLPTVPAISPTLNTASLAPLQVIEPPSPMAPVVAKPRTTVNEAVAAYLSFIRTENASAHVSNKVSMFRRFLGDDRIEAIGGPVKVKDCGRNRKDNGGHRKGFFRGIYLDEITPVLVQQFIEGLGVGRDTMRHYRQCFHHWFTFCLKMELYSPTTWHRPNPISALPGYTTRNRRITFLSEEQIAEQLAILHEHPVLRMGAAIMIHAGLRLSEALWLTRDSISPDLSFLSVRNRTDQDRGVESSLKTGERTVTILPPLRQRLESYLATLNTRWLLPTAKGRRWRGDTFGAKLRTINQGKGLSWTCLTFRHTFATQRAAEGWPLFRIAKEMGNSVAVVEKYYAGFIRPTSGHDGR